MFPVSLAIKEWKWKPHWDLISPQGEWLSSRKQTSAGEDVKQKEPSDIVVRNVN
jgi:hypothetical protein